MTRIRWNTILQGQVSRLYVLDPLLTPDEVARIGVEEGLVFISKQNVIRDKKASVYDHPRKNEIASSPEDKENWYEYTRKGTDIDGLLLYANDLTPKLKELFVA